MMIRRLKDTSRADLPKVGGKAANLGELMRLGLPVPPGFVVDVDAHAEQARAWQLVERLSAHLGAKNWDAAASEAAEIFEKGTMLPAIVNAVRAAYRELGAARVAVRSSATAEDLADASFAGQYETHLDIAGEDALFLALRQCWASLWSPRALQYREARNIDHLRVDIAVVVQQMVPSEFAGVLFTVDPVAQRADRMLLEVAPGLGEAVVSGHTTGDVYRLRRDPLGIEERERKDPARPAPSDALVLELCRVGLGLEEHFGCPQDVEFAFAGGSIHLLQSRPITTLEAVEIEPIPPHPELNRAQKRMLEQNDNDRFPIAPKPLDQWGLRGVIPALARTLRFVGLDVDEDAEREVVERVWREFFVPPPPRPSFRLLGLPRRVAASLRFDWMGWWEGEVFARIHETCAPVDLRALEDEALLRRADGIIETLADVLGKRFEGIVAQMAVIPLRAMVTAAVGPKRAGTVLADLLSGVHTRTSDVNIALYRLAQRASAAGPEITRVIREGRIEDLQQSEAGRSYHAEVEAFLDEHGYRESVGFYISAPMWRQDPTPMWGLLRIMLDATEAPSEAAGYARHRAAVEEVLRKLRFVPGVSAAFHGILERLRAAIVYRERSHFDIGRFFSAVQAVVAEIAHRLHERGHLPSRDDIFYLTEAEVKAWLRGNAPSLDEAKKLVRRRRATYGVVNGKWQKRMFGGAAGAAGDELRGIGASSGVVRGKARVVRDEREFGRLREGEILICRYTNPAWTPLFVIASGVVTDVGGAASHAAIVAREYGIPAVLGVTGATARIADGDEILIDGTEGRVTLLRKSIVEVARA